MEKNNLNKMKRGGHLISLRFSPSQQRKNRSGFPVRRINSHEDYAGLNMYAGFLGFFMIKRRNKKA